MTATLAVGLLTMISFVVYGKQISRLAEKVEIKVYLKQEVSADQTSSFENYLKSVEGVDRVDFISKEQALESHKEINKNNPSELETLEIVGDVLELPASFTIKVEDFDDIQPIQESIKSSEYQELTEQSETSEDKLRATRNIANALSAIRKVGIITSLILGSISILIIVNTVRLAIFNRKDEIEIMHLVGANKHYIKGPFLVEAATYGAIAGILTYIIMRLTVFSITKRSWAGDIAQDISIFTGNDALVGLGVILVGIFIGIMSAQIAIRKYVKIRLE